MDRFTAESVLRAATGGCTPAIGDLLVYTEQGWVFRSQSITIAAHAANHHSGGSDALVLSNIAGNLPTSRILGIGARVYQTVSDSVPDATNYPLTFGAESYDSGGLWDPAQPTRLTIPAETPTAIWMVVGCVAYTANNVGTRHARIHKNGSLASRQSSQALALPGNTSSVEACDLLRLVAGDYLELAGFQNTGGPLNTAPGETNVWLAALPLWAIP